MPHCDACDRHWTPTSMRADGSCPSCGRVLLVRPPPAAPPAETGDDGEEDPPEAPWHFKALLVAIFVYLAWRGVQGIGWLAERL